MRLKKSTSINKRTALSATSKTKKATEVASAVESGSSQQAALARYDTTLKTKQTTAKAQQHAANVAGGPEADIDTAALLNRNLARNLLDAIKFAVQLWKVQAGFRNIRVFAVSAIGAPGCLDGPELAHYIAMAPSVNGLTGNEAELREAVAEGVSDCFGQWQSQVTVPGLPWYPAFAAFPGPEAPPMPNVPFPLIACTSTAMAKITGSSELHRAITDALPDALRIPDVEDFLFSIAQSISLAFLTWLPAAQVLNVMGRGPIPTFAPPYVPVGPVVGGSVIHSPGHLLTAPPLNMILLPNLL